MNIDQTKRPQGEEGEELIVEELFIEDYGDLPFSAEAEQKRGVRARAKNLVQKAPKRSIFGFVVACIAVVSALFARRRRHHHSKLARLLGRR